jgi:hypothetical protein
MMALRTSFDGVKTRSAAEGSPKGFAQHGTTTNSRSTRGVFTVTWMCQASINDTLVEQDGWNKVEMRTLNLARAIRQGPARSVERRFEDKIIAQQTLCFIILRN